MPISFVRIDQYKFAAIKGLYAILFHLTSKGEVKNVLAYKAQYYGKDIHLEYSPLQYWFVTIDHSPNIVKHETIDEALEYIFTVV